MAKDAGLAVVLTILTPGLGHVYLEEYTRGALFFLAFLGGVLLIAVGIGLLIAPAAWIYAGYDVHQRA